MLFFYGEIGGNLITRSKIFISGGGGAVPAVHGVMHFLLHVEAHCVKMCEEKLAFDSLSSMDFQIGDFSDAISRITALRCYPCE